MERERERRGERAAERERDMERERRGERETWRESDVEGAGERVREAGGREREREQ